MASDLSEQLTRLGHKAELLLTRYNTLLQENKRLREVAEEQAEQLNALRRNNERLSIENEYLRISSAIAPDSESALEARVVLTDLVREIDQCIADLIKEI